MSKLAEKIRALRKQRGEKVSAYEALIDKPIDENRDLTPEEIATRDALRAELEKLDKELDQREADERALATRAVPIIASPSDRVPAMASGIERDKTGKIIRVGNPVVDEFPGAGFTRMAIALAVAGDGHAAEYAQQRWGNADFGDLIRQYGWMARAAVPPMSTGEATGSGGGSNLIVITQMGSEFIQMLRPALIVTRLPGVRRLNFAGAGQLKIPRQTGGISGAYIGEGTSIIVQRLNFDQLALTPSKLACIVGVTNELLRRSDPSIEMLIRDDLIEGTARTVDAAFMKTAAAPPAPPGMLTKSAELVAGEIPAAATFTQVRDAVRAMITAIRLANVQMLAPAWIMNPRTVEYLRMLIVSGTVDAFAFKMEIDQGTFFGFPIIASTNVPISGVDQSAPYALIDCSQIVFADDLPPVIDASEEATIQSDSAPATPPATPYTSAWQQDLVLFRIRMSHSWDIRHVEAVVWSKSFV